VRTIILYAPLHYVMDLPVSSKLILISGHEQLTLLRRGKASVVCNHVSVDSPVFVF